MQCEKWIQIIESFLHEPICTLLILIDSRFSHTGNFIHLHRWVATHHFIAIASTSIFLLTTNGVSTVWLVRRWEFITINWYAFNLLMTKQRWTHRAWCHAWCSALSTNFLLIPIPFKCCFVHYQIFYLNEH